MRDEKKFDAYWADRREAERTKMPSIWTYKYWLMILPTGIILGLSAYAKQQHLWPFN